jgi:hypothetical protein
MSIDNSKKSPRLLQSRRYTHDTFTDAQEAFTSVLDINANEVYVDQDLIPVSSIPLGTSGDNLSIYSSGGQQVMKYYYRYKMTKSSTNTEVWFFTTGTTAGIDAQLIDSSQNTNFISPKYSIPSLSTSNAEDSPAGYGVKVFVSTNASSPSAGDQISSTKFVFDYKTGVLQFVLTADAPTASQYVYISAYQYVGRTLKDALLTTGGTGGTAGTSGTSGVAGSSGTSGSSGATGSSGTSGTNGTSGSTGYEGHLGIWKYSGNTNTSLDPGVGYFNLDSPSWGTSTTSISLDNFAHSPNQDFSAYLDGLTIGTILKLVKVGDSTVFKLLKIDVVLPYNTGYENYTVSQLSGGGLDPSDNDQFLIIPLGIPGLTGTAGTSGTSGSSGINGTSGTSGSSGTAGSSGSSGTAGTSGTSGTAGTSGSSGTAGTSGTSGSSGTSGDSIFAQTGSGLYDYWATSKNVQITGSLITSGSVTIKGDLNVEDQLTLINSGSNVQSHIGVASQVVSGSVTLIDLGLFNGANFDYIVKNGLNMKCGNIASIWNGYDSSHNELNTTDLGNTTSVSFDVTNDGLLNVNVSSGFWKVEVHYRALGNII